MEKNNLIRFVQSLVLLPVMTMQLSLGSIHNVGISQNVLVQKHNINAPVELAIKQLEDLRLAEQKIKADAIDEYFKARNMPLEGQGMKMVLEAQKNGLDWRLLPAIAIRESTGGKNACSFANHNSFGWGSCKVGFKSNGEAIGIVAKNLGGNNPNTAHYYGDKTTEGILRAYNPPSIIPKYVEQVLSIMNEIGTENITPGIPASSSDPSAQKA